MPNSYLEKVLKRTKGTKITAGQMKALHKDNAPLKIFAGGKTVAFVDFKDIPEKDINREPSIIVKSRGIIEFEYYDKPFSHKNEMWSYHSDNDAISIKYIYYFLKINEGYFQKIGGKMQMPQIATPDTDKFEVPIPCPDNPEKSLAIQAEIVRILDKFTALTAELTAELTARKKQYNYYRDQLLCFDEAEVEWKTLADVAILRRGRVMSKGYLEQNAGDYPVYSSQTARNGMIGSIDTYDFDGEFISWTTDGANAGTVFYRTGKFSITNVCGLIKIHENYPISYKYLYYWLSIEAQKHVYSGMGNPKLMSHQVEKITVPIPFPASPEKSMLEQQRIVGILDKLEAITFSLTEGLPREIELRQKQYEYYRDLLFSFPKPDSVTN
ncbi:restriction endonuclease subunit S [Klebsiella pneumoniae]|uniref:restriction endonuclease subunit S n=1 Tax=Klebsiella pneumoniae TaxID=573 RepID=UPI00359C879B